LTVDDEPLHPLAVLATEPYAATFLTRATARPGTYDATVVVERRRMVADGLREDVVVRNYGREAAALRLALEVDADFADLFDVKEGRRRVGAAVTRRTEGDGVVLSLQSGSALRSARVRWAGATAGGPVLRQDVVVPARGEWTGTIEVLPGVDGQERAATFPTHQPVHDAVPALRMHHHRINAPVLEDGPVRVARALRRSVLDLAALRIVDPEGDEAVAAGAPWFMALFGRDSLLTSMFALPFDPGLALGTLRTLARYQGTGTDLRSEEDPGKI